MAIKPSAPCMHCKAENLEHRRACWRCKRTLPTSFPLDARLTFQAEIDRENAPTHDDIRVSVRQAVITSDRPDPSHHDSSDGSLNRRLVWFLRDRSFLG